MTEQDNIAGLKAGDEEAFERLYRLHKGRVYSVCLRMTRCVADAEDLTQEVFIQIIRKIGTFRGDSALSTWIYRVAKNIVLMHMRQRMNEVALSAAGETAHDERESEIPVTDPSLANCIERMMVGRAIESLALGYRKVFVLHDIEGYEHKEIALLLGFTIHTSKSQLHKARLRLRESFGTLRSPAHVNQGL